MVADEEDGDEARVRAMQKRMEAGTPSPKPIRCQCGNTYVPVLWQAPRRDYSDREARYYCPACLPHEFLYDVIWDWQSYRPRPLPAIEHRTELIETTGG